MKIVLLVTLLLGLSAQASHTCNYLPYSDDEDTTNYPTYIVSMVGDHTLSVEDISAEESFELMRDYGYQPTKANKGYLKFLAPMTSTFKDRGENAFKYIIVSPQVQKNRKSGLIKLALEVAGGHGLYYDRYSCTRD